MRTTRSIHGSRPVKSGSSSFTGALSAIPRMPSSVACLAPARVPECQIALPRFGPRFTPERTTSTPSHRNTPRATQSAGVPLTRNAGMPSKSSVGRARTGRDEVIEWPADERSTSGATTRTSPSRRATDANTAMPGL
jgi:hypothetical protein